MQISVFLKGVIDNMQHVIPSPPFCGFLRHSLAAPSSGCQFVALAKGG